MTITYFVRSETLDEADVEFVDSESTLSHRRTINIRGLNTPSERQERYTAHERTFTHRLGLGIIREPDPTPVQVEALPPE